MALLQSQAGTIKSDSYSTAFFWALFRFAGRSKEQENCKQIGDNFRNIYTGHSATHNVFSSYVPLKQLKFQGFTNYHSFEHKNL